MKTTSIIFSLVIAASVVGCATGIKGTPNEVTAQTVKPRPGYGVVFGRICGGNGLWFRAKDTTGPEFLHIGGKTAFALQLHQGDYQLVQVGSPVGDMATDKPLEFSVTDGAVEYVGSLLPRWSNNGVERFPGACNSEESRLVKTIHWSNRGTFGAGKPIWELAVANDMQAALRDVKLTFPSLDISKSQSNLMH